ncbi:ATP-binding protein [uncultured Chryseobacterium sp.]|uniref:ATP-binding protein n=1 Tax=uncultured Chryseobacterium sp. TaxID=259322 RepID=UPI0025D9E403|nr:ATP-binding protein [uncultured Chryseobacterium sp.]
MQELNINADRICEAISKIGYNPSSAIMDIIDNSFMANAKEIVVKLFLKDGMTVNNARSIDKIIIVDNGNGMDEVGITKAMQLGSSVTYENNSLSKYGLGLKSAGFSLGRRIEIVSKVKDSPISQKYFLDRDVIKATKVFGYDIEDTDELQKVFLESHQSGTLVSFSNLTYTSRVSASKLVDELSYKAGVNYYEFLKSGAIVLKIEIYETDGSKILKEKTVQPKDMLFWNEAYEDFVKETYDCKKPCKVLDTTFDNPLNPAGEKIKIQATIFPKDGMKTYSNFTEEEQKKIKEYEVSLKNSGFYFYRNGRLIKWGEKLYLNRDFGLRVKISFVTEHDELFDVDVSKQHLTVSEDVETVLKFLVNNPKNYSKELFEICDNKLKASKNTGQEGAEFNVTNSTLEEEDDQTSTISKEEEKARKDLLEKNSENLKDDAPKYENEGEDNEAFRRVRYWSQGRNLWENGLDRIEGGYVLINKTHPFYDLVLSNLDKGSFERQAIEAIFYSLAVGQNQTVQKFADTGGDIVLNIFKQFSRSASHQLDNWVNNNWDLTGNED